MDTREEFRCFLPNPQRCQATGQVRRKWLDSVAISESTGRSMDGVSGPREMSQMGHLFLVNQALRAIFSVQSPPPETRLISAS